MATLTYMVKVQPDGSLLLPKEAQEQLRLQPGDQVEIQIQKAESALETEPQNPLLRIIGIARGGPPDGAQNHDAYLYGKKPR
jgi:bifunctional DNA-binding transcriptional regulator/antitoxin component of YhaV-PrlF toxin-antitoxin module